MRVVFTHAGGDEKLTIYFVYQRISENNEEG